MKVKLWSLSKQCMLHAPLPDVSQPKKRPTLNEVQYHRQLDLFAFGWT
jgi:hypothetical protein